MSNDYDVIIIGTGAGGGTSRTASHLRVCEYSCSSEATISSESRTTGRAKPCSLTASTRPPRSGTTRRGSFHPGAHYWVGGNTKVYGAILFRLRERDFGEVRHHGGISPAWPLSYMDFKPYYTEAEKLYLVHGEHGEDPTEPLASGPYPYPAVSHEPRIQRLADDFARTGHQPFHLPVGINLDEQNHEKSACVRCGWFDGYPCMVDGKADSHVCAVRPALRHDNVTLITNARVDHIDTDPTGRSVSGVVTERDGHRETYRGNVVVVSCGAVNSAALLLRSTSDRHPDGLGNSSGTVGRHYMCHINSAMLAISKEPNPTRFQKTLGINDYYWGSEDFDYPLGHIQMLGKTDGPTLRAGAPWFAPGFALEYTGRPRSTSGLRLKTCRSRRTE